MNNLLLRRIALMGMEGEEDLSQYAITAKTNPEMMAALYAEGVAANPKYMTKEEAAVAFAGGSLPTSVTNCENIDLRWFIGWRGGFGKAGNLTNCKKLTIPNYSADSPIGVNTWWPASIHDGMVIIIPQDVKKIDPFMINSNIPRNVILIFEPITPPNASNRSRFFQDSTDGWLSTITIYVPDNSLAAYAAFSTQYSPNFYSQYTLKPISEYVE